MKNFMKNNWKYMLYGLVFVILVVILVKLSSETTGPKKTEDDTKKASVTEETKDEKDTKESTEQEAGDDSETTEQVEAVIYKYFDAMASNDVDTLKDILVEMAEEEEATVEKTSQYTESYNNIVLYTKDGQEEGSYVVFASYEVKFVDVKTTAPGVLSFYVVTKEDGKFAIQNKLDEKKKEFIQNMVVEDEEVAALFEASQKRYEQALTDDAQLKEFVDNLGKKSTEVAKNEEETETAEASQPTEAPENKEEGATQTSEEKTYVEAKENVNVRNAASETADPIGKLAGGETAEKTGEKDGWIRINYKGQEGYVKGEFVQESSKNDNFVSGTVNTEEKKEEASETETGNTETENTETTETTSTQKGTVRLKETANVRKSMSQESEKLGTAFVGDSYPMIEEYADGWTKIDYNGKTGYIKSEFLE